MWNFPFHSGVVLDIPPVCSKTWFRLFKASESRSSASQRPKCLIGCHQVHSKVWVVRASRALWLAERERAGWDFYHQEVEVSPLNILTKLTESKLRNQSKRQVLSLFSLLTRKKKVRCKKRYYKGNGCELLFVFFQVKDAIKSAPHLTALCPAALRSCLSSSSRCRRPTWLNPAGCWWSWLCNSGRAAAGTCLACQKRTQTQRSTGRVGRSPWRRTSNPRSPANPRGGRSI